MLCPTCSSENAQLEDGQFFCTGCGSQQLATREETVVEETLNINRRNVVGSANASEASLDESVSSTESKECSIYECYNILLYKQVSALIHLGVSEKLKNVVLFMWSKYLLKCEKAFMEESTADQEKTEGVESSNTCFDKKHKTKKKNKNQGTQNLNSDSDAGISRNDGDAGVSRNDSMEIDEPSRAAFFSQSKNFWTRYKGRRTNRIDRMCISKTLCFCYLGLLYIQDRLMLTDLLRLVQEEKIPFLNAVNYIPSSMLYGFPAKLFYEKTIPDVSVIASISSRLIRFLELPKLNNRSLVPIALNFVRDLNLPDNIIHIIKMLEDKIIERKRGFKKSNASIRFFPIPIYEVQAIALIIIVLKMFYVLDGEYELNHCEISRKINIVLQDRRLFVWDEWKKQASLKEYLFLKPNSRCSKISLSDSLKASQIISKYGACSEDITVTSKTPAYRNITLAKQNIAKVFNSLRSGNEAIPETPAPTSFPLTQNLSYFLENWKNMHMYKETEEIDFSLLTESFSTDILFYKPSSSEDESSKEIIELLCDSLYQSVPCMDGGTIPNVIQTSSNYWYKLPARYDCDLTWLNDFSSSFRWLLQFMSKYINTSCQNVYLELLRLEKMILPPLHKVPDV